MNNRLYRHYNKRLNLHDIYKQVAHRSFVHVGDIWLTNIDHWAAIRLRAVENTDRYIAQPKKMNEWAMDFLPFSHQKLL